MAAAFLEGESLTASTGELSKGCSRTETGLSCCFSSSESE
uniref:Uncharacterized protein n=1 Tax=Arundo donax TaxID=35708 RepID=A0A0A9HK76_ARUDO